MSELHRPAYMREWLQADPCFLPVLQVLEQLVSEGHAPEQDGLHTLLADDPAALVWVWSVQETLSFLSAPLLSADGIAVRARSGSVQLDRQAFALLLMWLVVLTFPAVQVFLPDDAQAMLNSYCGAVALALAVQWRMNDKRKR